MDKWYKLLKAYDDFEEGQVVQMKVEDAELLVKAGILEETEPPEDTILDEQKKELRKALKQLAAQVVAEALAELKPDKKDGQVRVEVLGPASRHEKNYGYENWTPYFQDVRMAFAKGAQAKITDRLAGCLEAMGKAPSGMGELIGEDGGLLVPTELNNTIFEKVLDEVNLLAMIDMYSTGGNSMEFKSLVENSRAAGSRFGGVRSYWLGEGAQLTGSKPKFAPIKLKLEKLGVMINVTDELLSDSGMALEQYLTRLAGKEIAFMVGDSLLNGDGNAKPLGVINANCTITVQRALAGNVKFADITGMWSRMPAAYRAGAVWLANQEVEPQLDALFGPALNVAGAENVGGWPVYLPPGGIADAPYGRLKGRPVMLTEWNPALGTAGDLMLCQWSQYCGLSKGGVQSAMSIHLRFDYDESVFRFIFRIDGQPWWPSALTPYKGINTLSPFVILGDAA